MFILYSADLVDIAEKHGVMIHSFADDTQLYLHCGRDEMAQTTVRLEQCITDINHCMSANRQKLSADKTELFWVGTKYCLSLCFLVYDSVQILFLQVSHLIRPQSREACFQCQRHWFPPSSSTSTYPAFSQHGLCCDTRSRIRDIPRRLL